MPKMTHSHGWQWVLATAGSLVSWYVLSFWEQSQWVPTASVPKIKEGKRCWFLKVGPENLHGVTSSIFNWLKPPRPAQIQERGYSHLLMREMSNNLWPSLIYHSWLPCLGEETWGSVVLCINFDSVSLHSACSSMWRLSSTSPQLWALILLGFLTQFEAALIVLSVFTPPSAFHILKCLLKSLNCCYLFSYSLSLDVYTF